MPDLEGDLPRYWHVAFFDKDGHVDHNDIVDDWREVAQLSDGRQFAFEGPATLEEYLEQQKMKAL